MCVYFDTCTTMHVKPSIFTTYQGGSRSILNLNLKLDQRGEVNLHIRHKLNIRLAKNENKLYLQNLEAPININSKKQKSAE